MASRLSKGIMCSGPRPGGPSVGAHINSLSSLTQRCSSPAELAISVRQPRISSRSERLTVTRTLCHGLTSEGNICCPRGAMPMSNMRCPVVSGHVAAQAASPLRRDLGLLKQPGFPGNLSVLTAQA